MALEPLNLINVSSGIMDYEASPFSQNSRQPANYLVLRAAFKPVEMMSLVIQRWEESNQIITVKTPSLM